MGVKNAMETRVLQIFKPCEPNDNGLAQRACSLCKGHKGTGGTQLDTAKSKMHGHLALQCEYLANSQDPKDQEFLAECRKRCPRSVATSKRSREIRACPRTRHSTCSASAYQFLRCILGDAADYAMLFHFLSSPLNVPGCTCSEGGAGGPGRRLGSIRTAKEGDYRK